MTPEQKKKLLDILTYAQANIDHPDRRNKYIPMYTDGVVLGATRTSQEVRLQSEQEVRKIEQYETFIKDAMEIIRDLKNA